MRVLRTVLTPLALVVAIVRPAAAQQVNAGLVAVSSDHELLGDPLLGGQLGVRWQVGGSRFVIRAMAAASRQTSNRIGIPCAGLIPPGDDCAEQPLRDEATFREAAVGGVIRVLGSARAELGLTADLTVGRITADSRASLDGRVLSADRTLWGTTFGAEATWFPWPSSPVGLEAQLSLGRMRPRQIEQIADGYTPFESGLRLTRVVFGIGWRPRAG
ncbi:MAG: hypothetical protein U0132_08970 [Gemmatimonadaceae bacterium]